MQKSLTGQNVEEIVRDQTRPQFTGIQEQFLEIHKKLDKIMTILDTLVGEVQDKRDEQTLHQGQHDEVIDQLENHDIRLKKLEHHTV